MCRIAIFHNSIKRSEAISILENMLGANTHGCGEAYIKDGKFVVNKYALSLTNVLKRGKPFLNHLGGHQGYTLVHLRAVSVGVICRDNSHPFVSMNGRICLVHNGTWKQHRPLNMYLQTCLGYKSTTDTAAATELISRIGGEDFTESFDDAGVFCFLNQKGELHISKTSGQLAITRREDKSILIASELDDDKYKNQEFARGYYKFDLNAKVIKYKPKEYHWQGQSFSGGSRGYGVSDWYQRTYGHGALPAHYHGESNLKYDAETNNFVRQPNGGMAYMGDE